MARRSNNRGFVLLEVLVAVAVAGVILVVLLRSFVSTWYGITTVREEAEAVLIARTLINSVAPRENAAEVEQQGSIGRYNWALQVRKAPVVATVQADTETQTPFPWTLYRVGVVVTAPNGRRTSLETTRLSRP